MNRRHKHKFRVKREADVVILPITGGFDVFTGKGWEQWTRFQTAEGYPKMVAGAALTEKQYGYVYAATIGGKNG